MPGAKVHPKKNHEVNHVVVPCLEQQQQQEALLKIDGVIADDGSLRAPPHSEFHLVLITETHLLGPTIALGPTFGSFATVFVMPCCFPLFLSGERDNNLL
jgi:hypothetical protein